MRAVALVVVAWLLVAWLLVACVEPAGDTAATVDPSDASRVVEFGGERWNLLVAPKDGQGMRGRTDFGGADGMLFDLGQDVDPGGVVFVMDGVAFPLDIAWFTDSGDVVGTASMAVCPAEPCPRTAAPGRFRWAIEAPPGAFEGVDLRAGLRVGD